LTKFFEDVGHFLAAPLFVVDFVAGCQALQVCDEFGAVGDDIGSYFAGGARFHDLLGAARSDFQERLQRFAIDPRPGEAIEFGDDLV